MTEDDDDAGVIHNMMIMTNVQTRNNIKYTWWRRRCVSPLKDTQIVVAVVAVQKKIKTRRRQRKKSDDGSWERRKW